MAFDTGMAEALRDALTDFPGLTERKMFGGLCFMLDGNMLCGVHKNGGMFRVGPDNEAAALAVPGSHPMTMTNRPMKGFVEISYDDLADDNARAQLLRLALEFVTAMPAK